MPSETESVSAFKCVTYRRTLTDSGRAVCQCWHMLPRHGWHTALWGRENRRRRRPLGLHLGETTVQGSTAETEPFGGSALIAANLLQHSQDVIAFH